MALGQLAPSATTLTDLYKVPHGRSVDDPCFTVCNRGAAATSFRIAIATKGEGNATKQYVYYDLPINANDTFASSIGAILEAADVVRVYAGNGNLSFAIFGKEI